MAAVESSIWKAFQGKREGNPGADRSGPGSCNILAERSHERLYGFSRTLQPGQDIENRSQTKYAGTIIFAPRHHRGPPRWHGRRPPAGPRDAGWAWRSESPSFRFLVASDTNQDDCA